MSEAVEKWSNSLFEKSTTLRNTLLLKLRPVDAPTRDARNPTATLAAIPRNARAAILPPVVRR